jgi:glycosyltransferase involved in cell wall biosynthesis
MTASLATTSAIPASPAQGERAAPLRPPAVCAPTKVRLLFLIRDLWLGGAARQLTELVRGLDKTRFDVTVLTYYDCVFFRQEVEELSGVRVISLGKRGRWDNLGFLRRLYRAVRRLRPHVIHGYMGVANELSVLLAKACGARAVMGVRASNMDFSAYDWAQGLSFRLGGWLSRFADLVIVNSYAGLSHCAREGYSGRRMTVIHNGIDTTRFYPDPEAGARMHAAWGLKDGERCIGTAGRLDPMKDLPCFLQAVAMLARERRGVRFVCVGEGPAAYEAELRALGQRLALGDAVIWAGPCRDMRAFYGALDVFTLTSNSGEGFPNVVGEAMACGVPCAVTDVGDAARVVGDVGLVVPPRDATAMKWAWAALLDRTAADRAALGRRARRRIEGRFSVRELVRRTEQALEGIL